MGNLCCRDESEHHEALGGDSATQDSEPLAPVELPAGWKAVPSRSRPGKVAYQNIHTGERISWVPTEEAKTYKGGITKKKKKKTTNGTLNGSENGAAAKTTSAEGNSEAVEAS
mmetsp:Transcript_15578/g.30145  ORF Transcript_15578/g.30145 Transcript_15578/m.30145 type:complete len:113 (+) Transcript_15578:139-477(+)|eukprot:CAMPEP_0171496532 /NCGR_PEP_ID=MMETSP0958-20121227/6758_1 /TAXON_ID=87120 /ORGANISM="Aurantiochytrium limacinum, Strain ATCCMYA-1381" /LENGTH=112 /DNA_ID=CAMNT_0012030653 /DNA_START=104 /DNA_END=442 /DNA_ORIENTATION=-